MQEQALLGIASPINRLTSLQLFYDPMESHVRGLESLGRSHESYGDLLAPIILGELPHELRKNLARKHDSPEWKFQELREAIVNKIRILEAGIQLNGTLHGFTPTITSSFLTQIQGSRLYPGKSNKPEPKRKCTYCKGPHSSYNCNVITDGQQRWSIIRRERLCYNCLGNLVHPGTVVINLRENITPVSAQGTLTKRDCHSSHCSYGSH